MTLVRRHLRARAALPARPAPLARARGHGGRRRRGARRPSCAPRPSWPCTAPPCRPASRPSCGGRCATTGRPSGWCPLDDRCLARAVEIGATYGVRIVDAIHLAAADRLPGPVRYLTFDRHQIPAADALGFEVVSPVAA